MGSPLAPSHGRVFGKRKSALQIQDLRKRYQQASDQLEHFLGYEPESSEVIPYLVKLLLNEGKVSGDQETVGSEIAKALHIDYESGVGMVATQRLAAPSQYLADYPYSSTQVSGSEDLASRSIQVGIHVSTKKKQVEPILPTERELEQDFYNDLKEYTVFQKEGRGTTPYGNTGAGFPIYEHPPMPVDWFDPEIRVHTQRRTTYRPKSQGGPMEGNSYLVGVSRYDGKMGWVATEQEALDYLHLNQRALGAAIQRALTENLMVPEHLLKGYEEWKNRILSGSKYTGTSRYQAGDRVRLAAFDFYSGIPEGATGTVTLIYGFHGRSPYPDPAKRLLFVTWDEYGQVSVPVKSVERVRGVQARHADNYRKWFDEPTDLLIPEDDIPPTPQEWQPYEGGEDGPSQESKRGGLVHLRVHRLA